MTCTWSSLLALEAHHHHHHHHPPPCLLSQQQSTVGLPQQDIQNRVKKVSALLEMLLQLPLTGKSVTETRDSAPPPNIPLPQP